MEPLTMGLIGGAANLVGSIFSSQTSASNTQAQIAAQQQMQQETEAFNSSQADINRQFQEQMSSTAYQRASKDMQAAGLNPMMMFGSGSSASTPSGSVASVGTPTVPTSQKTSPLAQLGQAASQMIGTAVQAKTLDKMTDEIANLKATQANIAADTAVKLQQPALVTAETGAKSAEAALKTQEARNVEISRQIVGNEATKALHEREFREAHPLIDKLGLVGKTGSEVMAPLVSGAIGARRFMPDRWFW